VPLIKKTGNPLPRTVAIQKPSSTQEEKEKEEEKEEEKIAFLET
jgi:hypothetical protein